MKRIPAALPCLLALLCACAPDLIPEAGRFYLARKTECDESGVTKRTIRYKYDAEWRLVEEAVLDAADDLESLSAIAWLPEGKARKTEIRPNRPGFKAETSQAYVDGRLETEESVIVDAGKKTEVKTEYRYNRRGDLEALKRTARSNATVEIRSERYEYEYDDRGRPLKKRRITEKSFAEKEIEESVFQYDSGGRLVSEKIVAGGREQAAYRFLYNDKNLRIARLRDDLSQNEFFEYHDCFDTAKKPRKPTPPVREGLIKDFEVRVRSAPRLTAPSVGKLAKGDRVSIHEVSPRVDRIEDRLAPWYRITTVTGVKGWVYGWYVFAEVFARVPVRGGPVFDPAGGARILTELRLNKDRARFYEDLEKFIPAASGGLGETVVLLRWDNRVFQSGNSFLRFCLIQYKGRELWVAGSDLTALCVPHENGFFVTEENLVIVGDGGQERAAAERVLVLTDAAGARIRLMPLLELDGDACRFIRITSVTSEDADNDNLAELILSGTVGAGPVSGGPESAERTELELWTRLEKTALKTIFEKKISTSRDGQVLFTYDYEFLEDAGGRIDKIVEIQKSSDPETESSRILYVWNGELYEKSDEPPPPTEEEPPAGVD